MRRRPLAWLGAVLSLGALIACDSTTSHAVSGTSPTRSTSARTRNPFSTSVERTLRHHPRSMSVAAYDLTDGQSAHRNSKVAGYTASIVKVAVLIALEQHDRAAGHALSRTQRQTAVKMIEASDNDATTALWRKVGGAHAMFTLFRQLHMKHTVKAPTLFEPWDGVMTTAGDQIILLRALLTHIDGVTAHDRHYVLHLMQHVEASQDWGRADWDKANVVGCCEERLGAGRAVGMDGQHDRDRAAATP